jgi:hypothetical protein
MKLHGKTDDKPKIFDSTEHLTKEKYNYINK